MKNILRCLLVVSCLGALSACQSTKSGQSGSSTASTTTSSSTTNPFAQFWSWLTQPSTQKQIQNVAQALQPVAAQGLSEYLAQGGNISSSQAAALGFQSAVALAPTVSGSNVAVDTAISDVATQFAGDPNFKNPSLDLAQAALKLTGTSPQQIAIASSAAGVALSNATQTVVTSGSLGSP